MYIRTQRALAVGVSECFIGKELIHTSSVPRGRMIKGQWFENTGLKRKHVRKAIKILNEE